MKKILYWFTSALIGIVLLLAITNPTMKDFKRFVRSKGPIVVDVKIKKTNHFVFSYYEARSEDRGDNWGTRYIGVFGTFIEYSSWTT